MTSDQQRFTVIHEHGPRWAALGRMGYEHEHLRDDDLGRVRLEGLYLFAVHLYVSIATLPAAVALVSEWGASPDSPFTGGMCGGDSAHEWCEPNRSRFNTILHAYLMAPGETSAITNAMDLAQALDCDAVLTDGGDYAETLLTGDHA